MSSAFNNNHLPFELFCSPFLDKLKPKKNTAAKNRINVLK
jgi:hypothetical protein